MWKSFNDIETLSLRCFVTPDKFLSKLWYLGFETEQLVSTLFLYIVKLMKFSSQVKINVDSRSLSCTAVELSLYISASVSDYFESPYPPFWFHCFLKLYSDSESLFCSDLDCLTYPYLFDSFVTIEISQALDNARKQSIVCLIAYRMLHEWFDHHADYRTFQAFGPGRTNLIISVQIFCKLCRFILEYEIPVFG